MMNALRSTFRRTPIATKGLRFRPFSSSQVAKEIRYIRFETPGGPRRPNDSKGPNSKQLFSELAPPIKFFVVLTGLGGVYYVTHLEQVPYTGRWRFMNTSPKTEAMMGEAISKEIHTTMGNRILPQHHPVTRHVRRVVSRILTASNLGVVRGEKQPEDNLFGLASVFGGFGGFSTPDSDFGAAKQPNEAVGPEKEWEVIVVNDKAMINAMAGPGVVVVFTGILPVCRDEEGLSAVLAHEIGHIVARHPAERLSSQAIFLAAGVLLQLLGLDYFISSGISTYFLELPNSRTQEREADVIGLRLMSRACYNPEAAPAMFERLGQVEKAMGARQGFEFARTHPSSERRAKLLEQMLPEAKLILSDNPECTEVRRQLEGFRQASSPIRIDDAGAVYRV